MSNLCKWILACGLGWVCAPGAAFARPAALVHEWTAPEVEPDLVGDLEGTDPAPQKVLQDTVWIADWTHDVGSSCSKAGWTHVDNHVLNDGSNYWHIEASFSSAAGIAGKAAAVGYHGVACCADPDGYANDWYQAIRITYTGNASLSLDFIVDSEVGFDYFQVETDSACASFALVDFDVDPDASATNFRTLEIRADGTNFEGQWNNVLLSNYGLGTHCAYIAFFSDNGFSPCDGSQVTTAGEAVVVDNIVVVDASGTRSEDFEDGVLNIGTFLNIADSVPFGTWARLYRHVTDNDNCAENSTCAWLGTDYTTPTLFNDASMSFGPGGFVIKGWLDDMIISPWVSLASTPTAGTTVLQFRRFPGNFFSTSRIAANWSVRSKSTVEMQSCLSDWGHALQWNSLSFFGWQTLTFDMSSNFDPTAEEIQVRHRTSDWQWIAGASPPNPYIPGPGPYVDRTRIGRRILTGPVLELGIDTRSQAQDCFPTEIHLGVTPAGQHYRPTTDRFGTCAYSEGTDLGINKTSPNLITGDSTWVQVRGVRPGGETVTAVQYCGAIVRGPHVNKAPAPYTVSGNGFFCLNADSVRSVITGQVLAEFYFVDLDDTYFRGGDELHYFWAASDNGGGFSSDPRGLAAMPASVTAALAATGGLREVTYLPAINWDAGYLGRIAADPQGDLEPTAPELAGSTQRHCILYVNHLVSNRRGGKVNRTSFMYALDKLGYMDAATNETYYDVYDHQGMGNTNNHLGGRATIEQAQGYNLIVYDAGNSTPGRPILPNGLDLDAEKIDQASWFQNWLAQAAISQAGFATLWVIGVNVVQEKPSDPLISTDMGVSLLGTNQTMGLSPDAVGIAAFTFDQGIGAATANYAGDTYRLSGGCPVIRNYDDLQTSAGTAVVTHRYRSPITGAQGGGTIIMNRNNAAQWNTILQAHPWFDIHDPAGTPAATPPERVLLSKTLNAILPPGCIRSGAVDVGDDDELDVLRRTVLHQNVPNPFNPMTVIRFDLARSGRVQLRIYDVAGRLVRTLVDAEMPAGRDHEASWNGLDDSGQRLGSGVYFYRLDAAGERLTRKLVVMK